MSPPDKALCRKPGWRANRHWRAQKPNPAMLRIGVAAHGQGPSTHAIAEKHSVILFLNSEFVFDVIG